MSEPGVVTKTKAPAKPRAAKVKADAADAPAKVAAPKKTVAKKAPAAVAATPHREPSHQEIALLAERFWVERGWQDGHAEQDWQRAEQELRANSLARSASVIRNAPLRTSGTGHFAL